MTGTFDGKTYRIAGRSVLGVVEAGRTYYWNEFNLETDSGEWATLVYEETGTTGAWRWFTMFDPKSPMTAELAATKEVGDMVNIDGISLRIDRVDHSRVYRIDGKPAENLRVGDQADYFNAGSGQKMLVVSWTGAEVEFYKGKGVTAWMVASAFKLRGVDLAKFHFMGGGTQASEVGRTRVGYFFVALVVVMVFAVAVGSDHRPTAVTKFAGFKAPVAGTGAACVLDSKKYQIVSDAFVEVAEPGVQWARHEFGLVDADGDHALLIYGFEPDSKDWVLFQPLHPLYPLTPQKAGGIVLGQTVNLDEVAAPVRELCRSTIRFLEGPDTDGSEPRGVSYGIVAQTNNVLLLVRWNESEILFHQGKALREEDVKAAFEQAVAK